MVKHSAKKRHSKMVKDPRRTPALLRAVEAAVQPGDLVLDIGTGLGVLAIAAAKAGASRVWAIDVDAAALEVAMRRALDQGVSDRISFVHALSFDVKLPRRADVALCEAVGSFGFDENILATLADAKKRLLRKDARILPQRLELWAAPISRLPAIDEPAEIARVTRADLMGPPRLIKSASFSGAIPKGIHVKARFPVTKAGTAKAVALWPRATWFGKEVSDASPLAAPTHWMQGIMPLEPRKFARGEKAAVEIIIEPHPEDPFTMTERLWRWI